MDIKKQLAEEFSLKEEHCSNIVDLLDQGDTVPFIARYRKEMHGATDDQVIRELADRYDYLKSLQKRKDEIKAAIEAQGKWTDELGAALDACRTLTEAEDVYRPYKQKKKTRASVAIARGLEPLADIIEAQELGCAADCRNIFLTYGKPFTWQRLSVPYMTAVSGGYSSIMRTASCRISIQDSPSCRMPSRNS